MEMVGTPGPWQSPGVCRHVGGRGCGRNKENQKAGGGGGSSLSMGEISHDHKGRRNEQEQKQTGTEGGRQINRAGEGGQPHRHQTQELPGERDPPDGKGDLCFKFN